MVRAILILLLFISYKARADFLGFKSGDKTAQGKIRNFVEKLKTLEMNNNPAFEEVFNEAVKGIEQALEEEKLFCSGESTDYEGKVLPKEQKQLCFRELKGQYLEAMEAIFNLKKKYLAVVHNRQIERMTEIQKKLREDIEKSF